MSRYTIFALALACSTPDIEEGEQPTSGSSVNDTSDGVVDSRDTGADVDAIRILNQGDCENPCTLTAEAEGSVVAAWYEADGWFLGDAAPDLSLEYTFSQIGRRSVAVFGVDLAGEVVASDRIDLDIIETPSGPEGEPWCAHYASDEAEWAAIQLTGEGTPSGAGGVVWQSPSAWTSRVPFAGVPGLEATHEGVDYVHNDASTADVSVHASARGTVAYVRVGCPQSTELGFNTENRECGAGWGNHVVVQHEDQTHTRYAHLRPSSIVVEVGDTVAAGEVLGLMGNSGRSDVRHLHFELGARETAFDPCASAQSHDTVHDPHLIGL